MAHLPSAYQEIWNNFFFMSGKFVFPYRHEFLEPFKEQIFSSFFNQILKMFVALLMFFPFPKYHLITFSLNSLQTVLCLVADILNSLLIITYTVKFIKKTSKQKHSKFKNKYCKLLLNQRQRGKVRKWHLLEQLRLNRY